MKTISALQLSRLTVETFDGQFIDCKKLSIEFFGEPIAVIQKHKPRRDIHGDVNGEIQLPNLCRQSKRMLKEKMKGMINKPVWKIISGQHDKIIVGYLVGV